MKRHYINSLTIAITITTMFLWEEVGRQTYRLTQKMIEMGHLSYRMQWMCLGFHVAHFMDLLEWCRIATLNVMIMVVWHCLGTYHSLYLTLPLIQWLYSRGTSLPDYGKPWMLPFHGVVKWCIRAFLTDLYVSHHHPGDARLILNRYCPTEAVAVAMAASSLWASLVHKQLLRWR